MGYLMHKIVFRIILISIVLLLFSGFTPLYIADKNNISEPRQVITPLNSDYHTLLNQTKVTTQGNNGSYRPGQIHVLFALNKTEGYAPMTVSFIDLSSGNPFYFYWQFGDGFTSSEKNPVHTYEVPGVYTVILRATNNISGGAGIWNNAINATTKQ